jgi:hypothetical protein
MQPISIDDIPQLDVHVEFDTEDTTNHNVIHPIFFPVLICTAMIV